MKHVIGFLTFMIFASLSSLHASAEPTVTPDALEAQVRAKIESVPEFKFIAEHARKNGIRVWLFGGTASSFAHYAKWDLLRQKGDARYQPDRFDYDYTNIYRSNQDLDIVIDAPPEKAHELQSLLASKFPHLQGQKSAWEVRLLRQGLGEKEAILGNPEFSNQHTDSHSVGMIELTANSEPIIRDLRDWTNPRPAFISDVIGAKLHYYFSSMHESTKRFRDGLNPPIISAVRYYIKAFQFELAMDPADEPRLRAIIERFDPKKMTDYEKRWLEKNAPKLFQNAVNIEYAWNVIEKNGLRSKLLAIGSISQQNSVAWWMNKEPLRSREVGRGSGATAGSLEIKIVAHETNTFDAYESITRAHTGDPNVLISREGITGEAAVHGDGFYTQIGRTGARGTKITIRFEVDPNAREGVDFIRDGNYVIFRNKRALRVIPESLNWGLREYVEFLKAGSIDFNERAMLEKLKRRLSTRIATEVSKADIAWFDDLVRTEILENKTKNTTLLKGWFEVRRPLDGKVDRKLLMDIMMSLKGDGRLSTLLKQLPAPKKPFVLTFEEYVTLIADVRKLEESSDNVYFKVKAATLADIKALGKAIKTSEKTDRVMNSVWFGAAYFYELSMSELLEVLPRAVNAFHTMITSESVDGKRPSAKTVRHVTYAQYIRLLELMPDWAGQAPEQNRTLFRFFVPAQPEAKDFERLAAVLRRKTNGEKFPHNVAHEWLERMGPLSPETKPFLSSQNFVTSLQFWLNDDKAPKYEVTLAQAFELMKLDFGYVQNNFGLRLKVRSSPSDQALLREKLAMHATLNESSLAFLTARLDSIKISTTELHALLLQILDKRSPHPDRRKPMRHAFDEKLKHEMVKASGLTVDAYLALIKGNTFQRFTPQDLQAMEANISIDAEAVRTIDERIKTEGFVIPLEEAVGRLWLRAHQAELQARANELIELFKRPTAGRNHLAVFIQMHDGLPQWAEAIPEFWDLLASRDQRILEALFKTERYAQSPPAMRRLVETLPRENMLFLIRNVFARFRSMDATAFLRAVEKHGPHSGMNPWDVNSALEAWKTHARMKELMQANSMWKRKMTLENVLHAIEAERARNLAVAAKPSIKKRLLGVRTCNALFVR